METVELTFEIKRFGPLAIMVDDGDRMLSLPVREIRNWEDVRDAEPGDTVEIEIPEWLAINEGLV